MLFLRGLNRFKKIQNNNSIMVKLYVIGMVPGDMNTYHRLDRAISKLNPDIIAVEETQNDIDSLMEDVKVNSCDIDYYGEKIDTLLDEYPDSNVYTLREFVLDEIWYYLRLNRSRDGGARIFGLDDAGFDDFRYAEAIEIYSARKDEFLSGVFSARPKDARMQIKREYNAINDQTSYIGDRPYLIVSDDELLMEYYEARDRDTADRLIELVDEESQKEKKDADTVIVYLCDITHFDVGYQNISYNLGSIEHSKKRLYDF